MKKKYYIYNLNINLLNFFSIILLALMFLLTYLINPELLMLVELNGLFFIVLFAYLLFHEILHCIGYIINGAKFKNITFGIVFEKGIMCCLCKQNISKRNILISLLFPLFFIGIVTYIVGIYIEDATLIMLSMINIAGAIGDIVMFINLLFIKDYEYSEFNDPISFAIYTEKDISKKKFVGLKYKETVDKLDISTKPKIYISKFSKIVLLLILLILLLMVVK